MAFPGDQLEALWPAQLWLGVASVPLQVPSPDLVTLCPFFSEDLEPETPPSPQMPLAVQWSLRETLAHLPVSTGGDVR